MLKDHAQKFKVNYMWLLMKSVFLNLNFKKPIVTPPKPGLPYEVL